MAPRSLVVLWRITGRCDLACPFCAYDRTQIRTRRSVSAHTALAFGNVLSDYARATGSHVLLSWLGGEPLTWAPLMEVSQRLHKEQGLALSLTTNGTRLGISSLREVLLEHYAEVTISVDGRGDAHDRLRGRNGLFTQLAASVQQLAQAKRDSGRGPLLRANVVLMRSNAADFASLCQELAGWGINEITFNQLGGIDRPEFYPANRLRAEQVDQLAAELPTLRAGLAMRGVLLRGDDGYVVRIKASSGGERIALSDCAPGRQFLFIDEAGLIAPCGFTPSEYGIPIAEITTSADIEQLPERFVALRRTRRASACADCHSTQQHGKFAVASA